MHGKRVKFQRNPKYAKGTDKLAADGKNGLAHHTEFQRPDGKWVAVRDNLLNPHYYYARPSKTSSMTTIRQPFAPTCSARPCR